MGTEILKKLLNLMKTLPMMNEGSVRSLVNDYPNPCDKCERCTSSAGCQEWEIYYRYRQKQINAKARIIASRQKTADPVKNSAVFAYPHPDEARRYLDTNPCDTCMCRDWCDQICKVRADWWDARIGILRRKLM